MSNVRTLRAAFPGSDWKSAFVQELLRLRPDMNPDAADEVSDREILVAQAMQPEAAAAHWNASNTPSPTDESRRA